MALTGKARTLIERAVVWDNHGCMPLVLNDEFLGQLDRYRAAGFNMVSLNIGYAQTSWRDHLEVLSFMRRWIALRPDHYRLITNYEDIECCKREGVLGIAFDVEGMCPVEDAIHRVQTLYELGVRWMLIAYNRSNAAGGGCLEEDSGLTEIGKSLIDEMRRLGMVLCLSHTGERTALEAIEYNLNPSIFSHSNPSAVATHVRNISDNVIKACAAKGGVIGLSGIGLFIGGSTNLVQAFADQILYLFDLVGPRHVGIGLDYVFSTESLARNVRANPHLYPPGLSNIEMIAPEGIQGIVECLLRSNIGDLEIEQILGLNWCRIAKAVWK